MGNSTRIGGHGNQTKGDDFVPGTPKTANYKILKTIPPFFMAF